MGQSPSTEESSPSLQDAGKDQGCCPAVFPIVCHSHPPQAAKAQEELLIKMPWCAGPVSCDQSSPGKQTPNCGKIKSYSKLEGMDPGVQFPSAGFIAHQMGCLFPGFGRSGMKACCEFSCVDHPSLPIAVPSREWGKCSQQELPLCVLHGLESRGISNKGTDF